MNRVPIAAKSLEGVVALVTGGASGLGEGVVTRLVAGGAQVVVLDVQASRARALAQRLPGVHAAPGDVLCARDVSAAVSLATSLGRLRAAVHCAGSSIARETYNFVGERSHPRDEFTQTVRVAACGLYRVAAAVVPAMSDGGVLLAVGAAGDARGQAASNTAGGAVAGTVRALRTQLAERGVRVATLVPGLYATPPLAHLPPRVVSFLSRQAAWPARLGAASEFAHAAAALVACPALAADDFRIDAGNRLFPM